MDKGDGENEGRERDGGESVRGATVEQSCAAKRGQDRKSRRREQGAASRQCRFTRVHSTALATHPYTLAVPARMDAAMVCCMPRRLVSGPPAMYSLAREKTSHRMAWLLPAVVQ